MKIQKRYDKNPLMSDYKCVRSFDRLISVFTNTSFFNKKTKTKRE